ncbi:MAG: helix-turn-helix domain-containing protein [Litorivicinaceae bacterium]
MGLDQQHLASMAHADASRCHQCALHALCLPGMTGCFTSALGPVVAEDLKVSKGQALYRSGDRSQNLYVVKSGAFKILTPVCGQESHVSGFRLPGDLVGACGLSCGEYAFTAVALDRSTVCRLPMDRLREASLRQPLLTQGLLQALSTQAAIAQRQITRANLPALARFALFLRDLSAHHKRRSLSAVTFDLPMPRTDIADYLSLAPETISRLLANLTKAGVIAVDGKLVQILDSARLDEAAEAIA